jgi:uncharacterized protein involved in oxidation of intracellular sulfur
MKLGIVIATNDPETVWNAFRLGNLALKENHSVKVFLINKGVGAECIKDEKFNVAEQLRSFIESKGALLACGTCLKARQIVLRSLRYFNDERLAKTCLRI